MFALNVVLAAVAVFAAWSAGAAEKAGTIDWANRAERPAAKLKGYLPEATPESQGGDSEKIAAWVKALDAIGDLHGFVLLRHGRLVAEGYWTPYERAFPHALNGAAGVMGAALLGAQQANGTPVEEAGELLDALTAKDPDRQLEEAFRLRELAAKRDVMYYEQAVSRRCMNYVGFTWEYAATPGDGGRTWDVANRVFLSKGPKTDMGYPSTVENADGTFLTVYYQPEKAAEHPCLMATKWRMRD